MGETGVKLGKAVLLCLIASAVSIGVAAPAGASDIHVDCSAATAGDGSVASPLNSIAESFDLRPDEHLLFRRNTTCEGTLRVTSGDNGAMPASVGAYGTGTLPKIVGTGQDAVLLEDVSNLTVRDLDVSNPGSGGPLGEGDSIRNGIRVVAQWEDVRNVTLTDLVIHDVDGDMTKSNDGSAAIQVTANGPPPVRFQNLNIKGNRITSVSRSAISINGTNDPDRPDADQPWPNASTGVVVENNRIDLISGDGIVPRGTDGAIVRGNVVSRGNLGGRLAVPPICNAGIWTFRSNNTLIRGNEVFGMKHNGCDGSGFDVDYRQDGTIIEGNYSHHNEGGFVLLCTDERKHRAEVRFNLSVDDGTMISHGPCGFVDGGILGDLSGIRMYNNTVVGSNPVASLQLETVEEMYQPGDFRFENNLVYARQDVGWIACGDFCSRNSFFGTPPSTMDSITDDPLLTGPLVGGEGMAAAEAFKLKPDSPLRGAGNPVSNGASEDFFGNPIPATPSVGFDQTPYVKPDPKPGKACLKARSARTKAQRKVKGLNRQLKKLRRKKASRTKVKRVARKIRKAKSEVRRQGRIVKKKCPAARASGQLAG